MAFQKRVKYMPAEANGEPIFTTNHWFMNSLNVKKPEILPENTSNCL
jgi:hypothetical protein